MSDMQVKRYTIGWDGELSDTFVPCEFGEFVKWTDYDALRAQLAAAEQRATYEADVAAQAIAAKEAAERQIDGWREREAAVCPEDVGFDELIPQLRTRAERAELVLEKAVEMKAWFDAPVGTFGEGQRRIDAVLDTVRALPHTGGPL